MDARNMVVLFADPVVIAPAFCTTLTVLKFKPANTHVTVFCVDFSPEKYQTTVGVFSTLGPSVSLQHVESAADFDDCIWRTSLGIATWGRLFLDKLLPRDLTRVLYLDCDTLVQSNLAPLLNAELGATSVGACKDQFQYMSAAVQHRRTELGLSPEGDYFNAGVMLFDWKPVIDQNLFEQARHLLRQSRGSLKLRFADQDILNLLLNGNWHELDPAWNLQSFAMAVTTSRQPRIAHFVGEQKPWSKHCTTQLLKFRRQYVEMQRMAGPLAQDFKTLPLVAQMATGYVRNVCRHVVSYVTFKAEEQSARSAAYKHRLEILFKAYDEQNGAELQ
jgi:lipopolysaccharide biosynthesis glycosyltransferase